MSAIALRQARVKMFARVQNAAMTMVGVFAQAHIRHHNHFREFFFDRSNRLLDNSIFREILQPDRILLFGDPKQDDSAHTRPCG